MSRLDEIRKRLPDEADGSWFASYGTDRNAVLTKAYARAHRYPEGQFKASADADFISAAPADIRFLIDECEKLRVEWNQQAKFWNVNTLRDSAEIRRLKAELDCMDTALMRATESQGEAFEEVERLRAALERIESERSGDATSTMIKMRMIASEALGNGLKLRAQNEAGCKCRCHKLPPEGWDSEQCCPDCGSSLCNDVEG